MMLTWLTVSIYDAPRLLAMTSRIVAVAMAASGLLAITSIRFDLSEYLRPFWTTDAAGAFSVAANAAALGRYGGIFNQPAEAGALYSIAGLAAVYVWRDQLPKLAVIASLIVIGGLISVSKIFILGGLPLILVYWMSTQRRGRKVGLVLGLVLLAVGIVQSGVFSGWRGTNYLARLLDPQGGAIGFYTAGRFESGSTVSQVIAEVLKVSPVVGVGAGGWNVAYDSALVESLVVAGVIGMAMYAITLIAVFLIARKIVDAHLRRFAYLFAILLVGAAAGFSPLTGNRVAAVAWLFIALLLLCSRLSREPETSSLQSRSGALKPAK